MTEMPDLNPLAVRLMGGADAKRQLREQLLSMADAAEDPAYAKRLREIADGRRPLRSILADPSWRHAMKLDTPEADQALDELQDRAERATGEEAQEIRDRANEHLRRIGMTGAPSVEEARAVFPEVQRLLDRAHAILQEDQLTGWQGSVEFLARQRAAEAAEAAASDEAAKPDGGGNPATR